MPRCRAGAPLIAVVDDDESICRAISSLVRSTGYRCAAFGSAEAFLDSGVLSGTACILLDIRMPGMGGLDLQWTLVTMGCAVPIIYVTATKDALLRERAFRQGASAFLGKPFDAEELLRAIARVLDGSDAEDSGASAEA